MTGYLQIDESPVCTSRNRRFNTGMFIQS